MMKVRVALRKHDDGLECRDNNGIRPEVWEVGEKNLVELRSGGGNQGVHLNRFIDFRETGSVKFRPTAYGRRRTH